MKILGIETSCDETAVCIIETGGDFPTAKIKILGNQLYSQTSIHAQYGGVYPMMAKREHAKNLIPLLQKCIDETNLPIKKVDITDEKIKKIKDTLFREQELLENFLKFIKEVDKPKIDAIAVTNGPGLEPALWVGVVFAKALSEVWDIPVYPINHMEGHVVVAPLDKISEKEFKMIDMTFPAIALLISGGHTQLVCMKNYLHYEIVGNTRDDAVGEAFDKVARILNLPYPGGPQISKLAEKDRMENPDRKPTYVLPRPMINSKDLNFSFSGIKTAVLYMVQDIPEMTDNIKQQIAREFEDAVTEVLLKKTRQAIEEYSAETVIIGGGVSANKKIRKDFAELAFDMGIKFLLPEVSASTDNAFMIALSGFINISSGMKPNSEFKAKGNLSLQ